MQFVCCLLGYIENKNAYVVKMVVIVVNFNHFTAHLNFTLLIKKKSRFFTLKPTNIQKENIVSMQKNIFIDFHEYICMYAHMYVGGNVWFVFTNIQMYINI